MNTKIKCLVTGGAGFIGSHLCDLLINKGYEVYCLDNLITGSKDNVKHLLNNPNFHFILHDVTKPFSLPLRSQLTTLNYIYHLASVASPPKYRIYAIETLLTNSLGTFNILDLAKETKAVFLLASTSEVYGNPKVHPQSESYFGHVNPVGLRACYDEAKRFAESVTKEYFRKYKVKTIIIRIFNTYGPRMQKDDGRVISNFVNQAILGKPLTIYGDGKQTRSFCFVLDLVSGLLKASQNDKAAGEVINIGNPDEYSVEQIAQIIIGLTKSKSGLTFMPKRLGDDPDRRKPDISKAGKVLGWEPKEKLKEGLIKTINYFKNL